MMYTDEQFVDRLREYLVECDDTNLIPVPVFRDGNGKILRAKTLKLNCFAGVPIDLRIALLEG